jgi:hypothetical protein
LGYYLKRFLNAGRMGSWVGVINTKGELEDGSKIELIEGELVRVKKRNNKETTVLLVHELLERR